MDKQSGFSWVELLVVLGILSIIAAIAIPRLHEAEISGNESAAASSVRTIVTAQTAFYVTCGNGLYASNLQALNIATLIDTVLASGYKEGYSYNCTGGADTFTVTASPQVVGETGRKYFYADESGVIRFSEDGPADSSSQVLGQPVTGISAPLAQPETMGAAEANISNPGQGKGAAASGSPGQGLGQGLGQGQGQGQGQEQGQGKGLAKPS